MRALRLGLVLGVAAVGGCRCGEDLRTLEADIAVAPAAVAFSRSRVLVPTTAAVQVGNRGTARLILTASVDPPDQGFSVDAPDNVAPGLAKDATVTFTPPSRGAFAADLVLASNDPDTPELRVPLSGEGGPPILSIDPDPVEMGLVNEGPGATVVVSLKNTGFDVLSLESASLADGGAFVLDASGLPITVAPGDAVPVTVSLFPDADIAARADAGELSDRLVVTHTEGEGSVLVHATVNLAPIAVAVEQVTRRDVVKVGVGRAVVIDGSETSDPEGDPFQLVWSLPERPASSTAALVGQGAPTTRVTPDVVGRYVVSLRAIDDHGAFSDAQVEILPRDLSVVLTWTASGAADCRAFSAEQCAAMTQAERDQNCCGQSDLDLHLIRPSGALGDYGTCPAGCDPGFCGEFGDDHADTCRQTGTDCAFKNRAPEWGAPGRIDDPRLDVDDVRGDGPEIVSLDDPEDGAYRVVVHYCLDRIGEPTLATVQVFEEGVLTFESAPEPLVEGEAWTAATLIRQNGAWQAPVAPPGVVETAPAGLCD